VPVDHETVVECCDDPDWVTAGLVFIHGTPDSCPLRVIENAQSDKSIAADSTRSPRGRRSEVSSTPLECQPLAGGMMRGSRAKFHVTAVSTTKIAE
jgi:hypothetical protein